MAYFDGPRQARRFTEFVYGPVPDGLTVYQPSKANARAAAAGAGVRTPELLREFGGVAEIALSGLPDHFVLKSNILASRKGVYLLLRRGADRYFDLFTQRDYCEAELREDFARRLQGAACPIFAEEFVVGENGAGKIPFDYKLYTFDGVPRYVIQIDRNTTPTGVAFFDGDFEPLESHCIVHMAPTVQAAPPVRPRNWRQLLAVASRIATHIDAPFISVDTYTTGDDVILGELTRRPGGPYYGMWQLSDEYDAELGTYFRLAYQRRGLAIPTVSGLPPVLKQAKKRQAAARAKAKRHPPPGIKASLRLLAAAIRRKGRAARARLAPGAKRTTPR